MTRPAELFAIAAATLLFFRWVGPIFGGPAELSIQFRGAYYVFPPSFAALVMATFLCAFATVYSLRVLPFNLKASLWHFWLTVVAIAVFWICFSLMGVLNSRTSAVGYLAGGWFAALLVALLAQLIFAVNLMYAVGHIRVGKS